MVSFNECLPVAANVYALGTLSLLWFRGSPLRKHHFSTPLVQCIHVLLVVVTAQTIPDWHGLLSQTTVMVLPALARYTSGQLGFRLASLVGMHALFQAKHVISFSLRTTGILLHLSLLAADLDAQEWCDLRQAIYTALYGREIALLRLSWIRDLTIDDFWAIPERFRLRSAHAEFQYNQDEALFVLRAIIRMAWRPFLPLILLQSLFKIAHVAQTALFAQVLACVENPSKHAWYEPYIYLAANLLFLMASTQSGRIYQLLSDEEARIIDSIKYEVLRLPLLNSGSRTFSTGYAENLARDVSWGLQRIMSELSSLNTAAFALWLAYRMIGRLAAIPIAVTLGVRMVRWGFMYIKQLFNYSDFYARLYHVQARDIYSNIKTIKFNCWEQKFLDPELADNEDAGIYGCAFLSDRWWRTICAIIYLCENCVWLLEYVSSRLSVFISIQSHIRSGQAMSGIEMLQTIDYIGQVENNTIQAISSFGGLSRVISANFRLEGILTTDPTENLPVHPAVTDSGPLIEMDRCSFTYPKKPKKDIVVEASLSIGSSQLVSVMGSVASGKTSLLLAMCGELEMTSGTGRACGRFGYLEQSPYIMNSSLRDNVLFGCDYDEKFYWQVMGACALMEDIDKWPDRDLTLIGERGVNISGGQKARLALARAVYTRADIYILDDPLSAVDAHVKRHLLDHVLLDTGLLGGKTRVVSMNSDHLLPFVNQKITIDNGQITVEIQEHPRVHKLVAPPELSHPLSPNRASASDDTEGTAVAEDAADSPTENDQRVPETAENMPRGKFTWGHVRYIVNALGFPILVLNVLISVFHPFASYIVDGYWIDALNSSSSAADPQAISAYLWAQVLAHTAMYIVIEIENAFRLFHTDRYVEDRVVRMFAQGLIHAPMSFFDSTNKQEVDSALWRCRDGVASYLPKTVVYYLSSIARISLSVYRIGCKAPLLLFIIPVMSFVVYRARILLDPTQEALDKVSEDASVDIDRAVDVISDGRRAIRLHRVVNHFTNAYADSVDEAVRLARPQNALGSFLDTATNVVDRVTSTVVTSIMVMQSQLARNSLTVGELKTIESFVNSLTSDIAYMSRLQTSADRILKRVDTLRKYSEMPCEKAWEPDGVQAPANWPTRGDIEFCGYSMRYNAAQDQALKDISLKINSGERIGIVGRTGAGKSSLTRALFRLVEGESGSILVDGVDISKLHASSLRPNLAIIPQDATSFAGSLRTNLDPLKQFTIEDMWAALIKAQLVEIANPKERHGKSKARSSEGEVDDDLGYSWESKKQRRKRLSSGWLMRSFLWLFKERDNTAEFLSRQRDWGLSKNLGDDGEGFTAGQWQQFGLARVLLRKRKILVLDEATADVDNKTDKVIHEAIHKEFAGCTILTIAHRLETVMNSDRIIVMDHGRVAEFDTPANLLAKGGLFAELVKSDGFANI